MVAVLALTFIMGYTRPAAEQPKEYIIVYEKGFTDKPEKMQQSVNAKLAEGWHIEGGIVLVPSGGGFIQAMSR